MLYIYHVLGARFDHALRLFDFIFLLLDLTFVGSYDQASLSVIT